MRLTAAVQGDDGSSTAGVHIDKVNAIRLHLVVLDVGVSGLIVPELEVGGVLRGAAIQDKMARGVKVVLLGIRFIPVRPAARGARLGE